MVGRQGASGRALAALMAAGLLGACVWLLSAPSEGLGQASAPACTGGKPVYADPGDEDNAYGELPNAAWGMMTGENGHFYPPARAAAPYDDIVNTFLSKAPDSQQSGPLLHYPRYIRVATTAPLPASDFPEERARYQRLIDGGKRLGIKIAAHDGGADSDEQEAGADSSGNISFPSIKNEVEEIGASGCFYFVFIDFALLRPVRSDKVNLQDIVDVINKNGMKAITSDSAWGESGQAPGATMSDETWAHANKPEILKDKHVRNGDLAKALNCNGRNLPGYDPGGCPNPIILPEDHDWLNRVHGAFRKSKAMMKFEVPSQTAALRALTPADQKQLILRLAAAGVRFDFVLTYPFFVHKGPNQDGRYNSLSEGTASYMLEVMDRCDEGKSPCN